MYLTVRIARLGAPLAATADADDAHVQDRIHELQKCIEARRRESTEVCVCARVFRFTLCFCGYF